MGQEANVGGVIRTIKIGEANVGGVVRSIKYGEANVGGVVRTIPLEDAGGFASTPWSEIIAKCAEAYDNDDPLPAEWAIGDTHKLKIYNSTADEEEQTDAFVEYDVVIVGRQHDEGEDNYAPLTLQLKDCFADLGTMEYDNENQPDGTSGAGFAADFTRTKMHLTTLPNILARIDREVRDSIRLVKKYGTAHEGGENVDAWCELFLLDNDEVFGESGDNYDSQQYEYYSNGGNTVKKRLGTENTVWWLRSVGTQTGRFQAVSTTGSLIERNEGTSYGISFAFCL